MPTPTRLSPLLPLMLGLAGAAAQTPAPDATAAHALLAQGLRVPIHTHPDQPGAPQYGGLWAGGTDYKVSFHDGVVFYPFLGPTAPEHLPFAWRTEQIAVGGEVLATTADVPAPRTSDWRHELHYPRVIEAYDVLAEGVEQTFTLRDRPAQGNGGAMGDWVVIGRVTTPLRPAAPTLAAGHQEIVFVDEGATPRVRYGAATAIDAAGARHPVTTQFDGERIRLTVDGAWLAQARFPVVLDPLTAAVTVHASGTQGITDVDLASTQSPAGDRVMVAFGRAFTATDKDGYALLTSAALTGGTIVFTSITVGTSMERIRVAYTEAAARWVIVAHSSSVSTPYLHWVDAWIHDRDDLSMSNARLSLPSVNERVPRHPDVGGSSGVHALLVYQLDTFPFFNNPVDLQAVVIDARAVTLGTPFRIADTDPGSRYRRRYPAVNQHASGSPYSWVAVWQEVDRIWAPERAAIWAQRITAGGQRAASAMLTRQDTVYKVMPQVAGDRGRYLATYLLAGAEADTAGPDIQTVRFDAPGNSSTIATQGESTLFGNSFRLYRNLAIAFDRDSASHWAITYEFRGTTSPGPLPGAGVVRVGYSGGSVESATLISNSLAAFYPSVTFQTQNPALQDNRFLVAYASPGIGNTLLGRQFTYDPGATSTLYGTGCGSGSISSALPRAGTEDLRVRIASAPPATPAILYLGFGPDSIPLGGLGMTGCVFNVSPAALLSLVTVTDGAGQGSVAFPLPDRPAFRSDLHLQWLYLSPGANPAGLQATRGLRAAVR